MTLKKVYFIGILDFSSFSHTHYVRRHLILNLETHKQEIEDFEFTFLELPKFNKKINELSTVLDQWLYFLRFANNYEMIPAEFENKKAFVDAFEIASKHLWSRKDLEIYYSIWLKSWDEVHSLDTAKAEGLAEGLEQGLEKGRAEMRAEVEKAKENAALEIAKKLLDFLSDDEIAENTGLPLEQIQALRKT